MANISDAKGTFKFFFLQDNVEALKVLLERIYERLDNSDYATNLELQYYLKDGTEFGETVELDTKKILEDADKGEDGICTLFVSFTGWGKWFYECNLRNIMNWVFGSDGKDGKKFFEACKSDINVDVYYTDCEVGQRLLFEGGADLVFGSSFDKCKVKNLEIIKEYEFTEENFDELEYDHWETLGI